MTLPHAITLLFWFAVATLATGLARRARLWAAGAPAPVVWSGLLAIPKRYFVDLHHVVARDPYIARTHIAVAGGAVAALVLVGINYGLAVYSRALNVAILVASIIMLGGTVFVWLRRRETGCRCQRRALADPEKTLAKVEELKAKSKAESDKK